MLRKISYWFKCILTIISPELNTRVLYRIKFGEPINLKEPKKLREKILKLKLESYETNELIKKCADKYAVREYIKEKGLEEILIPTIGFYNSVDEVLWEHLPSRFVMKWNFGCGYNFICDNKDNYDSREIFNMFNKWRKKKYYLAYSEMQYKGVVPKLIVEEFLSADTGGVPADYKIYCFNGKPMAILYIIGRDTEEKKVGFFDTQWNYLGTTGKKTYTELNSLPNPPKNLEKMIEIAKTLAEDFDFVRVDLYEHNKKVYFGELTFTPAGGFDVSECKIGGRDMGEYLII